MSGKTYILAMIRDDRDNDWPQRSVQMVVLDDRFSNNDQRLATLFTERILIATRSAFSFSTLSTDLYAEF